jgi:hypothetical protein
MFRTGQQCSLNNKTCANEDFMCTSTGPQDIVETLLTAVGLLLFSSFPEQQSHIGTMRLLLASWSAFSLLLMTALSSGLVSHLTQPPSTTQLNSVYDLVEADLYWGQAYEQEYSTIFNMQVLNFVYLMCWQ